MAERRRLKTLPDASSDLISQLPVEVKDRILECLPTPDAARTALLSTLWNDVWLHHGRLAFDWRFLHSIEHCYNHDDDEDEGRTLVNIINSILFLRAGPVKKFTLAMDDFGPLPEQSDFDKWCIFLSRNGLEELNISLNTCLEHGYYKLPFCLLSCRTIKQLIVRGPFIDLPVNASGIFSNVTSLAFLMVDFKRSVNGIASSISIPKLEKLAFKFCGGINKFEISSPKLDTLSLIESPADRVESRWLAPHLKAIKTLWLCGFSLMDMDVSMFPTAINLRVLKLYELNFRWGKQLTVAMQLLKKCPNLCELSIKAEKSWGRGNDKEDAFASRLLEDPDGCFVIHELKMLNTIKIESFSDSALKMHFMKMLLSKSPALKRVVILKRPRDKNASEVSKILRKLECFPRASPTAQIVCMGNYKSMRKDWLASHGFSFIDP